MPPSEESEDFLGLDEQLDDLTERLGEVAGEEDDAGGLDMGDDGETGWLLEAIDLVEEPVTALGAELDGAQASTGTAAPMVAPPVEGTDEIDVADREDYWEDEDALDPELAELDEEEAPRSSLLRNALIGFTLGLVAVVALAFWNEGGGFFGEGGPEVANNAPAKPAKNPGKNKAGKNDKPDPATGNPQTGTQGETTPVGTGTQNPAPNPRNPLGPSAAEPFNPLMTLSHLPGGLFEGSAPAGTFQPVAGGSTPVRVGDPEASGGPVAVVGELPPLGEGEGALLVPAGMTLIWPEVGVPLDSVPSEGRLLTPAVGPVRALMTTGEVFDGRLYGLGQGRIWIDTNNGRLGLDGAMIASVEHLPHDAQLDGHGELPVTGQRVRIQLQGGIIYGHIIGRDGTRVTVRTDKGGRITLDDPIIEPVSKNAEVVVKDLGID